MSKVKVTREANASTVQDAVGPNADDLGVMTLDEAIETAGLHAAFAPMARARISHGAAFGYVNPTSGEGWHFAPVT